MVHHDTAPLPLSYVAGLPSTISGTQLYLKPHRDSPRRLPRHPSIPVARSSTSIKSPSPRFRSISLPKTSPVLLCQPSKMTQSVLLTHSPVLRSSLP
ncbi:hypothetical protein B0H10DRAFT_2087788 [Mycena sp. CBHHK59/15]|nr:hypothetical protein B0H10DRAFT_2087788 [Mycena sp. CBHHK59/15]